MGTVNLPTPGQRIEEAVIEIETLHARIAELESMLSIEKQRDGMAKALAPISAKFRSGNGVPVERNVVLASEWNPVMTALASVQEGGAK